MKNNKTNQARRRALRAAQVVTLGLALAGCSESVQRSEGPDFETDGGNLDAASLDAGNLDAGAVARDAGECMFPGWGNDDGGTPCCDRIVALPDGGVSVEREFESWGCLAWGPYVPPGDAIPPARDAIDARRV